MKKQEKELFMSLCDFQAKEMDRALLRYASPTVLGALFFNRMQGVAYGSLKERELLGQVTREFRNSLQYAYDQNIVRNNSYRWSVCHLKDVLGGCSCRYAMLKGAMLCQMYPQGYRTSNDIDLLVSVENVGEIGEALYTAGIPDPDFIIRTSGEERISNFLLWQSAYAEYYFTKVLWPDFDESELRKALVEFGKRKRRFGK